MEGGIDSAIYSSSAFLQHNLMIFGSILHSIFEHKISSNY